MRWRIFLRLCVPVLLCVLADGGRADAQRAQPSVPAASWSPATPKQMGWSEAKLTEARAFYATLPPADVFVVDHGRAVVAWGDPAEKIKISSMRKSLLSALYGIYVAEGSIDMHKTMAQLGIEDDPPLTDAEKQATVQMLLEARSGVYHSYVAGTPAMRDKMPARGSHAPGTFWFYNNWDFNALGTIFEQETHQGIASAFVQKIAGQIQMQDFAARDMYFLRNRADSPEFERSRHAAYHFRMSARDLARFGLLMMRGGMWNGTEVVPRSWVAESTRSTSEAEGGGYGYLWWVDGLGLPVRSFSAQGALAKYVVVMPERELVVVYLNHAEFPDNASAMPAAELKALPTISKAQMGQLLRLLLEAQRPTSATRSDVGRR